MAAKVLRWQGGPGSGKTWQLLQYIRSEVAGGVNISDFAVMSFSRAQAADMAKKMQDTVFPDVDMKAILQQCKTIDGHALRACRSAGLIGNSRDVVIQPGNRKSNQIYSAFMEVNDLEFDPWLNTEDDQRPAQGEVPIGNQLVTLNAYLTSTMRPAEDWQNAAEALGLSMPCYTRSIPDLLHAWSDYKMRKGVFEHGDYGILALKHGVSSPAPILVVDEYQDVSPLQDALIQMWASDPNTDRVYVAGDPDQSIYGFRGCDPDLFLDFEAVDRGAGPNGNRPGSHRCPVRVMEAAEKILDHRANVSACGRKGTVAHIDPGSPAGLAKQIEEAIRYTRSTSGEQQPIFILSRFRKGASSLAHDLSVEGIPCSGIKTGRVNYWEMLKVGRGKTLEKTTANPWTLTCAIRTYRSGCDIDPIPIEQAESLITAILPERKRKVAIASFKGKRDQIRLGDVYRWIGNYRGDLIFDMLNLRPWIVRQIQACLTRESKRGYEVTPAMVKVDTIHASKGLEAGVVLLHTGYLKGRLEDLIDPDHRAEERRIYFVGATRASYALLVTDYGSLPTCPVLAGVTS